MTRTYSGISEVAVNAHEVAAFVADPRAGAVVDFVGVVRNHDAQEGVVRLDYSAHPQAAQEMERLVQAAAQAKGICKVAAIHRVGSLAVGDVAVVVSVSAEHRRQAFDACARLVDDIKSQVPIWKHQFFADGGDEWVGLGTLSTPGA